MVLHRMEKINQTPMILDITCCGKSEAMGSRRRGPPNTHSRPILVRPHMHGRERFPLVIIALVSDACACYREERIDGAV